MEIYRFGRFELDAERGELTRAGRRLPLQGQPLALLSLLLRRYPETVTRDEIRQALWPPHVHVEFSNSLNAAVSRLRDVLGDSASNPRFVETVPRKGYRFIAPVDAQLDAREAETPSASSVDVPETVEAPSPPTPVHPRRRRLTLLAMSLLPLLLLIGMTAWRAWQEKMYDDMLDADRIASQEASAHTEPQSLRLAVLPITTLSSEPDQDFIGDGLTEELIARLGALQPRRLAVIARTSVMPYKGKDVGLQEIARDLSVDHVLEGSLRQQGNTALITVRLVRVADQTQLWQRQFERRLIDFFDLQREIADDVAESLRLQWFGGPADGPQRETDVAEAYELYLLGQYQLQQRLPSSFEAALASFRRAAELDPDYPSAHAGIAQVWILAGIFDAVLPQQAAEEADAAIDRVLALDPDHDMGLLGRAYIRFVFQRQWHDAEEDFRRVLERSPNLSVAHESYAQYLLSQGRFDESLASLQRALDLDPMSLVLRTEQCWHLFYARRFDDAVTRCREALAMDADFLHAQDNLKWVLIRAGREAEAVDAFLRLLELEGDTGDVLDHYRGVAEASGLRGMLQQTIAYRRSVAAEDIERVVPYDMALDAAAVGDVDLALTWLERSMARKETDLVFLAVDPRLDVLRQNPRFERLLRDTKLPPIAVP